MSAEATNGTGQPATNAASQLPNGQVQGGNQYSADDIARLQRAEQQYKGAAPLIQAGMQYGLKTKSDYDTFGPLIQTLRQQGTDPRQLMALLSGQAAQASQEIGKEPENWTKADIERMVGERITKAQADMIRTQAEREHNAALGAEYGELEQEETLDSLLGEHKETLGKNAKIRELLRFALAGKHSLAERVPYGEDHPLKGQYGPAGREGMGKLKSWFGESVKELVTSMTAANAASIGKGARAAAGTPVTAGNGVSQGAPKSERKPGAPPTRADVQAALEARWAARGKQ